MIIYNPHHQDFQNSRIKEAEEILNQISSKYCFITGSFLYKKNYNDIDVFIVSRSKKPFKLKNAKMNITIIDFNNLSSLFYHSIAKSCLAKNLLPTRPLKTTLADYWQVINEAIPTILNQKDKYHKDIRFLILYTHYYKTGEILDTFQLSQKISSFNDYTKILEYIRKQVPHIITAHATPSYIKRFFYTQAGYYKELRDYQAQDFLYTLTHEITRGLVHG